MLGLFDSICEPWLLLVILHTQLLNGHVNNISSDAN